MHSLTQLLQSIWILLSLLCLFCCPHTQVQEAHGAVLQRRQAVPGSLRDDMHQLLEGARLPANVSPLPSAAAQSELWPNPDVHETR